MVENSARWGHAAGSRPYTLKQDEIELMEAMGAIDPGCGYCQREFYTAGRPIQVFAPRHTASVMCKSGKRPHCTCDACF